MKRRKHVFRSCTDRLYENAFSGELAIGKKLKFSVDVPKTQGYNFTEEVSSWGRLLPGVSSPASCWIFLDRFGLQNHIGLHLFLNGLRASGSPLWVHVGPS